MDNEIQKLGLVLDRQGLLDSIEFIKHEGMPYPLDRELFSLKLPKYFSAPYGVGDFKLLMNSLDCKNKTFMASLNKKYQKSTILVPIPIFEDYEMNKNRLIALIQKDPKKEDLIGRVQLLSTAFVHKGLTGYTIQPFLLVKKDKSFSSTTELKELIKELDL